MGGLGIVVNGFAKLELGACTIEERRVSELLAPPDFRFAISKVSREFFDLRKFFALL